MAVRGLIPAWNTIGVTPAVLIAICRQAETDSEVKNCFQVAYDKLILPPQRSDTFGVKRNSDAFGVHEERGPSALRAFDNELARPYVAIRAAQGHFEKELDD